MNFMTGRKCRKETPGKAFRSDGNDTLCITCRGCNQFPDSCSPVCISCICEGVSECGTADKIKLISTKDTIISGSTSEILCSLARVRRPLLSQPNGRRCARCPKSPQAILESTWSEFPDPNFKVALSRLYSDSRDLPECTACMQRTYNAITSSEKEMDEIRERAKTLCKVLGVYE
ncbi:MAG: hypothetical protein J5707_01165 [Candidatus Methanomethylophilus sp.]|nr:hypothetical protein [Methanomethylophilus sp.]